MPNTETHTTTLDEITYTFTIYPKDSSDSVQKAEITLTHSDTQNTYLLQKDRTEYSEYHTQFKKFLTEQLSAEYEITVDQDGNEMSEFEAILRDGDIETQTETRQQEIINSIVDISLTTKQTILTVQTTENNTEKLVFNNTPRSSNTHTHTIQCPSCNITEQVCGKQYTKRSFICDRCQKEYTQKITAVDATGLAFCELCGEHHSIITQTNRFTQTTVNIVTDEPVTQYIQCVCGSITTIDGRINEEIICNNCNREWELSLKQLK